MTRESSQPPSDANAPHPMLEGRLDATFLEAVQGAADRHGTALGDGQHSPPEAICRRVMEELGETGVLSQILQGPWPHLRLCVARHVFAHVHPTLDLLLAMQALSFHALQRGKTPECVRWREALLHGTSLGTFAITEPHAGTDLGALSSRADPTRDGRYRLNGKKTFITHAQLADVAVVFAKAQVSDGSLLTAFVVPMDREGVEVEPFEVLGLHPIGELRFKDVDVPASHRVGQEGDGRRIASRTLLSARPTVGAAALGFGRRAMTDAVHYVTHRQQFGQPLADLQAVQLAVSQMACDLESAWGVVLQGAVMLDRRVPRAERTLFSSMAKLQGTEAGQRIVDTAVQLCGGQGVRTTERVAQLYAHIRSLRIYEGANEIHRLLVGRAVLQS